MKPCITDISLKDLPAVVGAIGLKKYSASQIISWLYKERVASFDEMTNLSKQARADLNDKYVIDALSVAEVLTASDGTKKFLCRARDGIAIECVYIPAADGRGTVCLSTQAGCAMGCAFCRTAIMGLKRNLTQGEILGQLMLVIKSDAGPVTNIVLMGMGEPLANTDTVINAIEVMLDPRAIGFAKRRVTLSTSGIIPEIEKVNKRFDIKIAISLNATTDVVREKLMPINKRYNIAAIMDFCRKYSKTSRHRVTFEYVMFNGVNDSMEDAKRLVGLLSKVSAKVNLIPFNSFEGSKFSPPSKETLESWWNFLTEHKVQAFVRQSRGREIMAACGQLAANK